MSSYTPDAWKIVKITNPEGESHYRVFAGWYGGFAGSDAWKMNSGITKFVDNNDVLEFHGHSGSIYYCARAIERVNGYMFQVFQSMQKILQEMGADLEYLEFDEFEKEFKPC